MSTPITSEVKLILGGIAAAILIVALGVGIWIVNGWRLDSKARKADKETIGRMDREAEATQETTAALGDAVEDSHRLDIHIDQARGETTRRYEELRNENASVRDAADRAIPDELRALARARRESRDRSGGAEDRSGDDR